MTQRSDGPHRRGQDRYHGDDSRQRTTVRRAAIDTLIAAEQPGRFVDDLLAERIIAFERRDRHLLQEIAYGATRHQNTLDRLLKSYLKLPVTKQRPPVREALRVGAYQLVYLARIPAHAAVNQTLEAMKTLEGVGKRDVGFVNAVLHRLSTDIVRKSEDPPESRDDPNVLPIRLGACHFSRPVLPLYTLDPIDHLSVKYSCPRWLVRRWSARFGEEEARALFESNNRVPPVTARITARAPSRQEVIESLTAQEFTCEETDIEAAIVLRGGDLREADALREGWVQIQDLTALEIGQALAPPATARVLDLCAAPGGKATQLVEVLDPESGKLVAAERSEDRLGPVRENLERTGRSNWTAVTVPENPAEVDLGERFTHILADVPCSNSGVLARRPDARWRVRREDLEPLVELQSGLLDAAIRHLEPGGRLVYSTCSIEPEENEERIADCLQRHPDLTELATKAFLPHRTAGDGGFYSLLVKASG